MAMRPLIALILIPLAAGAAPVPATAPANAAGRVGADQRHLVDLNHFGALAAPIDRLPARSETNDALKNTWLIYPNCLRQDGPAPSFANELGIGILRFDDKEADAGANYDISQAKVASGEWVFPNVTYPGVTVTRRVWADPDGWVRIIDIIKNPTDSEQKHKLLLYSHVGRNPPGAFAELNKDLLATTGQGSPARVAIQITGQTKARCGPARIYTAATDFNFVMYADFNLVIPAGKEIALMHVYASAADPPAAQKFVESLRPSRLLKGVPAEIRRLIVNFRPDNSLIGQYELAQDPTLDTVELKTGERLSGQIQDKSFKITGAYGVMTIGADDLAGIVSVAEGTRHVLILRTGGVIGGRLSADALSLERTNKQIVRIPLSRIDKLACRGEAKEAPADAPVQPMLRTVDGDPVAVQPTTQPVEMTTRYGPIKLKPDMICSIDFLSGEHEVHRVTLADGSQIAGLLAGRAMEMRVGAATQPTRFSISSLAFLQAREDAEPAPRSARLTTRSGDLLVGALEGDLKFDTALETLNISAGEISRWIATDSEIQLTLADRSVVRGRLSGQELTCRLQTGVVLSVPASLIREYIQPHPQPAAELLATIQKLARDLDSDDWQTRESAQQKLTSLGPAVIAPLTEHRPRATPEGQQRIDKIVEAVER